MLLLVPFSYRVERRLETAVHIRGGEAEAVDRELAERYQSPYVHRVVLAIQGLPDPDSTSSIRALTFVTDTLRAEPGVSAVLSRLDWSDDLFLGKGGGKPATGMRLDIVSPSDRIDRFLVLLHNRHAGVSLCDFALDEFLLNCSPLRPGCRGIHPASACGRSLRHLSKPPFPPLDQYHPPQTRSRLIGGAEFRIDGQSGGSGSHISLSLSRCVRSPGELSC